MTSNKPDNDEIAEMLEEIAGLLEVKEANPFRIQAYRKAAQTVRKTEKPLSRMLEDGKEKLQEKLPGVGESLARLIKEYVNTGRSQQLERLRTEISPEILFQRVPGIGEEMAHRIAAELDVNTLEDLELAAHDGRLEKIEGFGSRRVEGIKETLAGMLSRSAQRKVRQRTAGKKKEKQVPPVEVILDVDREYRERAEAGELKKIAPKRFNPEGKAWLPIMRTEQEGWSFTALFSNTARAHDLNATHDWVVIYYERDGKEDQCTVVTEKSGDLEGRRVIRGRESECRRYYESDDGNHS